MGNLALRVEGLGKLYGIGGAASKSSTLVGSVVEAFYAPFQSLGRSVSRGATRSEKDFWALKDVSLEVKHGEVLGIIGKNGSGKSTLLKIISRVLDPTTGRFALYGRCGSLLEIGMGFHPELTGRENIYLNGAILGMKKAEIDRRLDSIVAFSEIEDFIDTPVKRYSSGMYVRLAFSVAAQMESEILIIDEVLAVGDLGFQRKCLRRMEELAGEGRTILFVSHGMETVRRFCHRAILLQEGRLVENGPTDYVVDKYLGLVFEDIGSNTWHANLEEIPLILETLPSDPAFRLRNIGVLQHGRPTLDVVNGSPVLLRVEYEVLKDSEGLFVFFRLFSSHGTLLFESLHNGTEGGVPVMRTGLYLSEAEIPGDFLAARNYELRVGAALAGERSCLPSTISLTLKVNNTSVVNRAYPKRRVEGEMAPAIPWKTNLIGVITNEGRTEIVIRDLKELNALIERLPADRSVVLRNISVAQEGRESLNLIDLCPVFVHWDYEVLEATQGLRIALDVIDSVGRPLCQSTCPVGSDTDESAPAGYYTASARIPGNLITPGDILLRARFCIDNVRHRVLEPIRLVATVQKGGDLSCPQDTSLGDADCHSNAITWQNSLTLNGSHRKTLSRVGRNTWPHVEFESRQGAVIQYRSVRIQNRDAEIRQEFEDNEPLTFTFVLEAKDQTPDIYFGLLLEDEEQTGVLFADSRDVDSGFPKRFSPGSYTVAITVPPFLASGKYFLTVGIGTSTPPATDLDHRRRICSFLIVSSDSVRLNPRPAPVNLRLPWSVQEAASDQPQAL